MSRAPSDDGPPARRQRTLLGFLKMSSLTRHSLEEMEVAAESGRLDGKRPAEGGAEGRD